MEVKYNKFSIILIPLLITLQQINSVDQNKYLEASEKTPNNEFKPIENLILNQNEMRNVNRTEDPTTGLLSRVKRQYSYDPYYYRRYSYPLPIFIGLGGFGLGRGFGGRGFGRPGGFGRGFGGFGGRGFGGFGGRGFGGFGGRGVGGFGGRGGRG